MLAGRAHQQWGRHLNILAALVSGIVASQSTPLPTIAVLVPDGTKPDSRVKRFARGVCNEVITEDISMPSLPWSS